MRDARTARSGRRGGNRLRSRGTVPGRGYGRQTVRALAYWLLGQPGITAVLAHTDPGNAPSRRSLVSAGFRFEGETGGQCRYRLTGQGGGSE